MGFIRGMESGARVVRPLMILNKRCTVFQHTEKGNDDHRKLTDISSTLIGRLDLRRSSIDLYKVLKYLFPLFHRTCIHITNIEKFTDYSRCTIEWWIFDFNSLPILQSNDWILYPLYCILYMYVDTLIVKKKRKEKKRRNKQTNGPARSLFNGRWKAHKAQEEINSQRCVE